LMGYLGLVPSEQSSGGMIRRGGITKTGNREARRMLIEAAWSYQYPARIANPFVIPRDGVRVPSTKINGSRESL
jgi:transposase